MVDIEYELIAAEKEPGFQEGFVLFAPDRLQPLIDYFSKYGCVVAVQMFENIAEQARVEQSKIEQISNG